MATNLSWLPGVITQDEGAIKLINGTNLAFSGIETVIVDGPNLNVLHEFNTDTFGSAHYVIHAECGSDQRETLNVSVVAKFGKASITVYGRINTGVNLVDISADITDSTLSVYATPSVTGLQNIKVTAFATLAEVLVGESARATVYYFAKINGTPKFTINTGPYSTASVAPALTFYKGLTYRIDQTDSSNSGNPFVVGTTADTVGLIYTTGITYYLNGIRVQPTEYRNVTTFNAATSRYIEIVVGDSYPATLYYFSSVTASLGNTITVTVLSDSGSIGGSGSGGSGGSGGGTTTGAALDLSNLDPTAINVSLLPGVTSSIDLGSASKRWRDIYLSGNSIVLGSATITSTGSVVNLPAGSTVGGSAIGSGGSGGSAGNSFTSIAVSGQSNVVADSSTDTLNLVAGSGISLTTDPLTDSITITNTGGGGGGAGTAFANIEVAGQSTINADSAGDTLTLIAGPNITITTNAGSDAITISASAGGGGASGVSSGQANRLAYYASTGSVVQDTGNGLQWNGTFLQVLGTVYATGQKSYIRHHWDTLNDLNIEAPATSWRGMIAYAQDTGKVYYAHAGLWNRLANYNEIPTNADGYGIIQVDGQTNLTADQPNDTMTFIAGAGMTITTNPTNNSITFTSSGGGGGGGITIEDAQDASASMFTGGTHTGIAFSYNDSNGTINATVTASAGIYTDEQAMDAAAGILINGNHSGVSFTYNDLANTLDATVTFPTMYSDENAQDAAASMFTSASHTGIAFTYADSSNQVSATVSGEYIQDQAAALFTAGVHSNISFNYDDNNNRINATVTLPTAYTDENAVDAVGAALGAGNHTGITFTYGATQDAANRIDATVSYNNLSLSGTTTLTTRSEVLNTKTGATGTVVHDVSTGTIWYHSGILGNFVANFTNVPTTSDRVIEVTLILSQGASPFGPSGIQVNTSAVTFRWQGNTPPTFGGNGTYDIVTIKLHRVGVTWICLGNVVNY